MKSVGFIFWQPAAGHTAASEPIRLERERTAPAVSPRFGRDFSFCAATAARRDARPAAHRPAAVGELRHYASIIHATIPISTTTTARLHPRPEITHLAAS
jgi:hypothetical protein